MSDKPVLIFDYDGTIHETLRVYGPAIQHAIETYRQKGVLSDEKVRGVSMDTIAGWLGMNAKQMWLQFAPELSQQMRDAISDEVGAYMIAALQRGDARWYEGAQVVFDTLKAKGYQMIILSNSKKKTGEIHFKHFQMHKWFDAWYDCESYDWKPKSEIIKEIVKVYGNDVIVIGDRKSDMDAARSIGAESVGCRYGYGSLEELAEATYQIQTIQELLTVLGAE